VSVHCNSREESPAVEPTTGSGNSKLQIPFPTYVQFSGLNEELAALEPGRSVWIFRWCLEFGTWIFRDV